MPTVDRDEVLRQRAVTLHEAGRVSEALALYDEVLLLTPRNAPAHFGRALALWTLGRREEAIGGYDLAIVHGPELVHAHFNRAASLEQLHRWTEALAGYDAVLALRSDFARAWNNRAGVLLKLDRPEEALASVARALALRPQDSAGHYNRGVILLALERFDEAVTAFERALAINPAHPEALGCLMTAALKSCDWRRVADLMPRVRGEMVSGKSVLPPLLLLNISDDPALLRRCAEINLAVDLAKAGPARGPLWAGEAYHHPRVRIGYLSSDFREHPVGHQVADLFERHDRSHFEIVGIFTGRDDGSAVAKRIARSCDRFLHAAEDSDDAIARSIRSMAIDVLVDLNGQTEGWRPAVLRLRPAPVQATWLGFAGTMGADFVDYIIADRHVAPLQDQAFFSEKILHLPDCFWPAIAPPPFVSASDREAARTREGLPQTGFVFCCFNNHWKIGAAQFRVWMRLLRAVPGSVLWLRAGPEPQLDTLRREAAALGVDPSRLATAAHSPSREHHMARQRLADLFLDTFPYNAHATASDALSAGLPLVTLRGRTFASRVAASLLEAVGLPELAAGTLDDYEAVALLLAQDPLRLAEVRRRLEMAQSRAPLFDPERFARNLEAAYLQMVKR
jgi:predicted O-linked N-acetylglucosamine transferase (SPINDLY family)